MNFQSVHDQGGWKRFIDTTYQDDSLQNQIEHWLAMLSGHSIALRRFIDRGWEVELNCLAQGSEFLVLSHSNLRELADLGISLSLTLVPGVEPSGG